MARLSVSCGNPLPPPRSVVQFQIILVTILSLSWTGVLDSETPYKPRISEKGPVVLKAGQGTEEGTREIIGVQ